MNKLQPFLLSSQLRKLCHANAIFFFLANLTPSNTSSKLLSTPFTASRSDTRKMQVLPNCSPPQSSVTSKSWTTGQGSILNLFLPHRNQRENVSLCFPTGLTNIENVFIFCWFHMTTYWECMFKFFFKTERFNRLHVILKKCQFFE